MFHLARSLELDSANAEVHVAFAETLAKVNRADDADRHFQVAVGMSKKQHMVFFKYATFLMHEGRARDALERFREAVKFNPIDPVYRIALGQAILAADGFVRRMVLLSHFY
jgi:Tfp pilus assembly protein PilF